MEGFYQPQAKVDWESAEAFSQFKEWKREVELILEGPLHQKPDKVKMNHVLIWAGGKAVRLIDSRKSENPDLKIETAEALLENLQACITHDTFFREAREQFYGVRQQPGEKTQAYYSRVIDLYKQSEFPEGTDFLIVDKLIHGCCNRECKRKLMAEAKDVKVTKCLDSMRRFEAIDATMKKWEEAPTAAINAAHVRGQKGNRGHATQKSRNRAQNIECTR